jgi:hypothetical protein
MIRCTIGGRMHWKPSARKVTYSSPRQVNLEVPMGSGSRLVLSHSFMDIVSNGKEIMHSFEHSPCLISLKLR